VKCLRKWPREEVPPTPGRPELVVLGRPAAPGAKKLDFKRPPRGGQVYTTNRWKPKKEIPVQGLGPPTGHQSPVAHESLSFVSILSESAFCSSGTVCHDKAYMSVYIFCDNSNVFIEGQWAAGRADGLRGPNTEFRIDYGQLLTVCAGGREVVQAKLYGSVPPPNDSLWRAMERQGWDVKTSKGTWQTRKKGWTSRSPST